MAATSIYPTTGLSQAAINRAKTHCPRGHPYSEENTYRHPDGRRSCRTCSRQRWADPTARRSAVEGWQTGGTIVVNGRTVPFWATAQTQARLWSKIHVTDNCWEWTGGTFTSGYGKAKVAGKSCRAHRLMYELLVGQIPDGLVLDHLCRNRLCVRPDHLEPTTDAENILRGEGLAAKNARKTHCNNGHPLDEHNTYVAPDGGRNCRSCRRASKSRYEERRRGTGNGR